MKNLTKQVVKMGVVLSLALVAATLYAQSCPVGGFNTGSSAGTYPWPVWTGVIPQVPPSSTGKTYYVDGTNGIDSSAGTTATAAFKTISKALTLLAAGDTILIRKGLYREPIDLSSKGVPSGTAAKPITIGSYGDGEVIVDGSQKVTTWRLVSGTVWEAPITFTPIGVVVNEVPLRQVTQGQGGSTAPQVGKAGVTSGSGKWYFGSSTITADMGTAIGSANPNQADIVVPLSSQDQQHVYFFRQSYITFKGLTIRGSGSNGIWGYGSNITVDSCNIKFNGKAAVSFIPDSDPGIQSTDNSVLYSHIYQNVLSNWPRGNNYNAEAGGGWPGTVVWSGNMRPLARGNIVYMNGGEGIISYGTAAGKQSGSALFEQNVAYDNWSVNMYFDNQPNNIARNNLLYNRPMNNENYLYVGSQYPYNALGKYSTCLMLADEQNSSDSTNGYANLANSQVYNNVMAGCRIGIRDYSEGAQTVNGHGLKNTVIANNTIIMPANTIPNTDIFGIYLQDNTAPSGTNRNVNTIIENNIIYGFNSDPVIFSQRKGALSGITLNYNTYYSAAAKPFGAGDSAVSYFDFTGWKSNAVGSEANSKYQDPLFVDVAHFRTTGTTPYNPANAALKAGSPALGAGASIGAILSGNFAGSARGQPWNIGAY